ncbi:hypothetical protein [Roseovarius sp. MBR-6]|uniref:hypothetical protein n=1 Tax=Roseovarius sp. MBR-6 TaxID=3156459 RepID=UPI0033997303
MIELGRLSVALAGLGLVAGCVVPPQGTTRDDLAIYEQAAQSLNCTLVTEGDFLAMEMQTGLARQQLLDITGRYLSTGGAERLPGGGVKLTTGACA